MNILNEIFYEYIFENIYQHVLKVENWTMSDG